MAHVVNLHAKRKKLNITPKHVLKYHNKALAVEIVITWAVLGAFGVQDVWIWLAIIAYSFVIQYFTERYAEKRGTNPQHTEEEREEIYASEKN